MRGGLPSSPTQRDQCLAELVRIAEQAGAPAAHSRELDEVAETRAAAARAAAMPPPAAEPFIAITGVVEAADCAWSARRVANGAVLRCAVPDVTRVLAPGDALDRDAASRGLATVIAGDARPVLPPALCAALALHRRSHDEAPSLWRAPLHEDSAQSRLACGEDARRTEARPACVLTVQVDGDGTILEVRCARAGVGVVGSVTVHAWQRLCDGSAAAPEVPAPARGILEELATVAQALQRHRRAHDTPRLAASVPAPTWSQERQAYVLAEPLALVTEDYARQLVELIGQAAATVIEGARLASVRRALAGPAAWRSPSVQRLLAAVGVPWSPALPARAYLDSLDPREGRTRALRRLLARVAAESRYRIVAPGEPTSVGCTDLLSPLHSYAAIMQQQLLVSAAAGSPHAPGVRAAADSERLEAVRAVLDAALARNARVEQQVAAFLTARALAPLRGRERTGTVVEITPDHAIVRLLEPEVEVTVPTRAISFQLGVPCAATSELSALVFGRWRWVLGQDVVVRIVDGDEALPAVL